MAPREYYHHCLQQLLPEATSHWPEIARAYTGRAYHNLAHLEEMLGHFFAQQPSSAPVRQAQGPPAAAPSKEALFGLALIYHDVVYTAGRSDNEARSADLLEKHLLAAGGRPEDADYCRRLIMATRKHVTDADDDSRQALLVDLDLAVLARPASDYAEYVRNIRQEFRLFPNFLYRRGRRKALEHFLAQENIYNTATLRDQWEATARQNLRKEIAGLQ